MRALPGVEFDAAWRAAAQTGAATSRPTGASTSPGPPGTVGVSLSACARRRWRSSPTAAAGSPSPPGPSGRAPRSGTPSRSCPPLSPGRGPSGSRRSGTTCRRGLSRGSTGWTPPAGGARSGRSAGRASPRVSRRPARRRSGSSRAAASPTTPRSTCWRDASGGGGTGGADLSVYDGFLKGAVADGS